MQDTDHRSKAGLAQAHARALFDRLGVPGAPCAEGDHPALAWRRAGLMTVTGRADGPGLVAPVALTAAADGALAALKTLAPGAPLPESGALLLGERARLLGLKRDGSVSPNGSCHLLDACDGRIALSLPRREDVELLPALLGEEAAGPLEVEKIVARQRRDDLVARGRFLGLAIAADERPSAVRAPFTVEQLGASGRSGRPLVIDLSALWAGPLAASLLQAAGARVVKVESVRRPDGARGGNTTFYNLLNGGKASVALDFRDPDGIQALRRLVEAADIVVESARPRALADLGVSAREIVRRGATWLSITAHGRTGEAANWVGFGDDAAVAGGLSAAMRRGWGETLFGGDAIADPLSGITAALAGWASWLQGGGRLVSVSLSGVIAHACNLYEASPEYLRRWQAMAETDLAPLYRPREPAEPGRSFGADTAVLLAELKS